MWSTPSLPELTETLSSPQQPIGKRMRAAYFLRQTYDNAKKNQDDDVADSDDSPEKEIVDVVIRSLCSGLKDGRHGSLMRHEFAYVMGQLKDDKCCDTLASVLLDSDDTVIVRHECAEALAAIGSPASLPPVERILSEGESSHPVEVVETCEIAANYLKWKISGGPKEEEPVACACMTNPYSSTDPAPPNPAHDILSSRELGDVLCDEALSLFERYRAMFSLRNRGGEDCVLELGRSLVQDESSAVFRHEVAYVLGQMGHSSSLEFLVESLRRVEEHEMVRHESAEALGALEDRWEESEKILREFMQDESVVVRESCVVALDAADYWGYGNDDAENGGDKVLNFVQQKGVSNGKTDIDILASHFNVALVT